MINLSIMASLSRGEESNMEALGSSCIVSILVAKRLGRQTFDQVVAGSIPGPPAGHYQITWLTQPSIPLG